MNTHRIFVVAAGLVLAATPLEAGQYFQDFSAFSVGATTFGDGSTFSSDQSSSVAGVSDGTFKELALTANGVGSTHSAFLLPDLDPGTPVYAFSAKWNSEVYGNFPNAADGFSFSFGQVGSLNLLSGNSQESGFGTGICFSVQNYVGNNPGFYLRVNAASIASQPYSPGSQWATNNVTRHFFEVDWNYATGVSVRMDGQNIFTNVPTPGLTFQAGNRFAWAARCGGFSEGVGLDNIVVVTGGNLARVPMSSPYFSDASMVLAATNAFDGDTNSLWLDFNGNTSPVGVVGATASPATAIKAYALVAPYLLSGLTGPASAPAGWLLEGSNNGSTWNGCGAGTGHFVSPLETRCWLATNSAAYSNYRLNVYTPNGTPSLGLAELLFYKLDAVSGPAGWYQGSFSARTNWVSVTSSTDGKLAAADQKQIYLSSDFGATWTSPDAPVETAASYAQIASSPDGQFYIATLPGAGTAGTVVTEADGLWFPHAVPANQWSVAACATYYNTQFLAEYPVFYAGGNNLSGFTVTSSVGVSTDKGSSWRQIMGTRYADDGSPMTWSALACSTDGSKVAIGSSGSLSTNLAIFISSDFGSNWVRTGPVTSWFALTCSADGSKLVAATTNYLYYSTDSGNFWNTDSSSFGHGWNCLGTSADGSKVVASGGDGTYLSTDYGVHWKPSLAQRMISVASSGDGTRLVGLPFNSKGNVWLYGPVNPQPPLATTLPPTGLQRTSAQLNGQGTAGYSPATAWFQWGATTNYGNSTPAQNIGSGNDAVSVSANISGLAPNIAYHYRSVGSNTLGVAYGSDVSFSTGVILGGVSESNGQFHLAFTGAAGQSFTVLASTNVALPLNSWTVIGVASEGPAGQFQFSDSTTNSQRFYRVRSP